MPKLCECGCGQVTKMAIQTDKKRGKIKGEHNKFITGHNSKGKNNPMYGIVSPMKGKKLSTKTKKKIGEANKGSKCYFWRNGIKHSGGYIFIQSKEHPFCSSEGYVKRSRLVMEKKLGRYLKPEEVVHHINRIRDDDRPENLKLFSNIGSHTSFHNLAPN